MRRRTDADAAQEVADVLYAHSQRLDELLGEPGEGAETDRLIDGGEAFLAERGIAIEDIGSEDAPMTGGVELATVPSWDQCLEIARDSYGSGHSLEKLFTASELASIDEELRSLNDEYAAIHRLDGTDVAICVVAGLLAAAVDALLVGVPHATADGLKARPLADFVRERFEQALPPEEMEKLAREARAKVPYDAPYSKGFVETDVEGLWPVMHRLYSLGHDPVLGFAVGVLDIMNGSITTIDKAGRVVCQQAMRGADYAEVDVFAAICKQFIHLKTDVTTSMGLPAPFMGVFDLMQFGSVGKDGQTVAEIVQGMYYEGYDFIHFCAQSIPVMIVEATVRLCYFLKRTHEGHPARDSIPFSADHEKHPKLGTMLFMAHSIATAVNAGKVAFTQDPMQVNYPEWVAFAVYSFKQAKWALLTKPDTQYEFVLSTLEAEMADISQGACTNSGDISGSGEVICLGQG